MFIVLYCIEVLELALEHALAVLAHIGQEHGLFGGLVIYRSDATTLRASEIFFARKGGIKNNIVVTCLGLCAVGKTGGDHWYKRNSLIPRNIQHFPYVSCVPLATHDDPARHKGFYTQFRVTAVLAKEYKFVVLITRIKNVVAVEMRSN